MDIFFFLDCVFRVLIGLTDRVVVIYCENNAFFSVLLGVGF